MEYLYEDLGLPSCQDYERSKLIMLATSLELAANASILFKNHYC